MKSYFILFFNMNLKKFGGLCKLKRGLNEVLLGRLHSQIYTHRCESDRSNYRLKTPD